MPWCDDCSKFWSPNSVPASGQCPSCGRQLAEPLKRPTLRDMMNPDVEAEPGEYKAPWHFKLMVALATIYLGWRFLQLLGWLL